MQNRDKLIREVAKTLGIPQTKVREVVSSQAELARDAMQKKEPTSVYLRQVGTFISKPVREQMNKDRREGKLSPKKKVEEKQVFTFNNNDNE